MSLPYQQMSQPEGEPAMQVMSARQSMSLPQFMPPPQTMPPPQPAQVQYIGGQAYIVQTQTKGPKVWPRYQAKNSIILGSVMLSCAILGMLLNVIGIKVWFDAKQVFVYGHAIWGGGLFILAGTFAVIAGKKKTTATIVTNMMLCIVASVIGGTGQVVISAGGITIGLMARYDSYHLAVNILILLLAITELIAACISSAICCAARCYCRRRETTTTMVPLTYAGGRPAPQTTNQPPGLPQAIAYAAECPPPYSQYGECETKVPIP